MKKKYTLLIAVRLMGVAMVILLPLLTVSPVRAKHSAAADSEWSEWKGLGKAYVARRRVPARIDLPKAERRLGNVQERLLKTKQLYERLLKKAEEKGKTSGKTIAKRQKKLKKLVARIARLEKREKKLLSKRKNKQDALWLRTGFAGLYSVSLEDLSEVLGKSVKKIRKKAKRGQLEMTNADNPVSWYFDQTTDSDSILFVGESYETFYTDRNAYRFKLGKNKMSQAMSVIDGAPAYSAGNAVPFIDSLTFEEEPDLFYSLWTVASEQDADYWFWDYLYGGYRDSIEIPLDIPDPASFGTAQLRVTMRGWTDREPGDEHQVYAELNGQPVGSMITWDGFEEAHLVADFDQSLLNDEGSNTLTLRNSYAPGTHPGQWLDQVDITYSRKPVAVNDMLRLHNVAGGTQVVTGFSNEDILVVQSSEDSAVMLGDVQVNADGSDEWSVSFNAVAGADYLVVCRSAVKFPVITADNAAGLAKEDNRAEYLIIAPREFEGTAEALAEFQRGRFDDVGIAWLDDIYNEFSDGRVDPTAIGRFMEQVDKWRVTPSYVVLVGKGSLDEKNRMGYSDSFVPVLMTTTPWALAASDDRLLGAAEDKSFAVGRIPITDDSEGIAYVDKLIAHASATSGAERFRAVLFADNPDNAGDFHLNSDLLTDRLLGSLGFTGVSKYYHPQDTVTDSMILSDTWETGYVNYYGHGSLSQVGNYREKFITAVDADNLRNTVYPVFTALTCSVGNSMIPGVKSLASALVLNPVGGAIASMATATLSLDNDAQILGSAFVDALFSDRRTVGNAFRLAKLETEDSIAPFMLRTYSVFGDPAVTIR